MSKKTPTTRPTTEELAELRRQVKDGWGWGTRKYTIVDVDELGRLLDAYEAQREALADARPVVANGVQEAGAPWQRETRQKILDKIDALLEGHHA